MLYMEESHMCVCVCVCVLEWVGMGVLMHSDALSSFFALKCDESNEFVVCRV